MLREVDEEEKLAYRRGYYGFLLCIIGPTIFFYFPDFMEFVIQQNVKLEESGTTLKEYWLEPPAAMFVRIYLFNITNPYDLRKGLFPKFQQIGPYVVRLKMKKEVVSWNTQNDTVSYKTSLRFFYDEELAGIGNNDMMYTVNLHAAGMVTLLKESLPIATGSSPFTIANDVLEKHKAKLIWKVKVKDLLLNGIEANFVPSLVKELNKFINLDKLLKYKKISLLQMLNSTPAAYVVAHTGAKRPYALGEIASLYTDSPVSVWGDKFCNRINGTEGQNFRHPVINRYQYFYLHPLCRSLKLDYFGNDDVYGIPTKKFIFNSMFTSRIYLPQNSCFCRGSSDYCNLNGTVPIGPCIDGLPITISKPHFYGADSFYLDNMTGLEPVPDDHESYFHLHTMLSIPLLVRICLQFNMRITRDENIKIFRRVRSMMLPITWMNLTLDIRSTGNQNLVYYLLVGPPVAAKILGGLLTVFGAIRLGRALFYPIISKNKQTDTSSVKIYPVDIQPEFKDTITKVEKY